jgi:hypothetical protein
VNAVAAADRWLFLTPEVEALLPDAAAALAAALGEDVGGAAGERARVERLVVRGRYRDWLAYLRGQRALLERYVARAGADALAGHVAALLNEQYMLALTVPGAGPEVEGERARVGELLRRARGPGAR